MRETLLVVAMALVAFGLTVAGSFHYDDRALLTDPAITSSAGWYEVWRPVQTRPLTYFTFWLNYQAGGSNPLYFHLADLALHAGAAALLLIILRMLLPPKAALIAALLFAAHPIQTEAVAYVFARATLLATLLCLVSLWLWLSGRTWFAVAWFALALLAKEECAAFPLFLLALSLARDRDRPRWAPIGVMLALSLAAGLRAIYAGTVIRGSGAGFEAGIAPLSYFALEGVAILRYLAMLIVPWGYTVDPHIAAPIIGRVAAWLAILGAIAIALRRYRGPGAGFWFIAGLILLAPSSTIFPAADLAADRRMYLPMIAFTPCAAALMVRWRSTMLAVVFIILAVVAIRYSWVWRSERSLWTEAVARAPDKVRPRIQLSRALEPSRAISVLNDAQRIAPADSAVASERGRVWLELGRPAEALAEFGRALALAPNDADAVNNRGVALSALGQNEAAKQDFERALKLDPCHSNARLNLQRSGGVPAPAACP